MAEATKHSVPPIKAENIASDIKSLISIIKTRRSVAFAYGFMFAFVAFTVFLAFNPNPNSGSSPWYSNIFSTTSSSSSSDTSSTQFSTFFSSLFYPNASSSTSQQFQGFALSPQAQPSRSTNTTVDDSQLFNQTQPNTSSTPPVVSLAPNNTSTLPVVTNQTQTTPTYSVINNATVLEEEDELIKSLLSCDLFHGEWAEDDSYPLYEPGSCPLIDEQFNCVSNGRPDRDYQKFKWKPKDCTLPRLDASHMLELLRGKRLVFVGDSLNRNMWESLVCILRNSAKDKSKVYEANGRTHFRGEAQYSFIFKDYNFSVEFFVSPFLVREWEMPDKDGSKKETLRLDLVARSSDMYKDADILIFNTGHWWTHDKTSKGKDYYQEGNHVYGELNVLDAFKKALTTWSRWVDSSVDTRKSMVFFRGYSASHFSGGQWNSGGQCDSETLPIFNETYLRPYMPKMLVLEKVLKNMKHHVTYLNITRLTDFRKDGHPSMYRKPNLSVAEKKSPIQDCSHWCLPGVPDAWNEVLYAELLVKLYKKSFHEQLQQQKKRAHR